jgi:hypothetical protein
MNTAERGWASSGKKCATEHAKDDTCKCPGGRVYYGTYCNIFKNKTKFNALDTNSALRCNNATFKDPDVGTVKECFCMPRPKPPANCVWGIAAKCHMQPRLTANCTYEKSNEKDTKGCPKYPCGKKVCIDYIYDFRTDKLNFKDA